MAKRPKRVNKQNNTLEGVISLLQHQIPLTQALGPLDKLACLS